MAVVNVAEELFCLLIGICKICIFCRYPMSFKCVSKNYISFTQIRKIMFNLNWSKSVEFEKKVHYDSNTFSAERYNLIDLSFFFNGTILFMLWTQLSIFFKQMLMKNEQCTVTNVTFYNGGGGGTGMTLLKFLATTPSVHGQQP